MLLLGTSTIIAKAKTDQNKNQYLIAMYLTLITKGYFEEIEHKLLVKGHT